MIAIDTNILSSLVRGGITELPDDSLFVPYVVLAEIRAGIASGNNPQKYNSQIDEFLKSEDISFSEYLDNNCRDSYVEIYTYLKKNGTPISPNDLWIAAECHANDLSLTTRDTDFQLVPQIKVINC